MARRDQHPYGYDNPSLCEPHAHAFNVTWPYEQVPAACEQTDPEEPVQCDACSVHIMREMGML